MKYPYIRAWCEMLGSSKSYTERQVAQAEQDKAPDDAIYYEEARQKWHVFSETTSAHTRMVIESLLPRYKK